MTEFRKHLTETGMSKGPDRDLPDFTTEPGVSETGDDPLLEPHVEDAEPGDLEPAVDDEHLDRNRSTRPQVD